MGHYSDNMAEKGLKINFEVTEKGSYITIISPKLGEAEYMGMSYDIPYLISILNILLDRSVHLSGKDVRINE